MRYLYGDYWAVQSGVCSLISLTSLDLTSLDLLQIGVANIREYESTHLQSAENAANRRNKLKLQVPLWCFLHVPGCTDCTRSGDTGLVPR